MKWIATVLLIAVFIRHNSSYWLGNALGVRPQMVFYTLGGLFETFLCAILGVILFHQKSESRHIGVFACILGIVEGIQIGVCGILQTPIPGKNLCDAYTHLPIGATLTSLYALFACWKWPGQTPALVITFVAGGELFYLTESIALTTGVIAAGFALWRLKSG